MRGRMKHPSNRAPTTFPAPTENRTYIQYTGPEGWQQLPKQEALGSPAELDVHAVRLVKD